MRNQGTQEPGPLAFRLYRKLQQQFGTVRIANAGESLQTRNTVDRNGRGHLAVEFYGETYRVNCPFCGDKRGRLWINHRFGEPDETGRPSNHRARCFNEDCLAISKNRNLLDRMIFGLLTIDERKRLGVVRAGAPPRELGPAHLPGVVIPLTELPDRHPAIVYLKGRGYDPAELVAHWEVGYCLEPDEGNWSCLNRLIAPIRSDGVLVGWQGRTIGEPSSRSTPKYLTMPGLAKTSLLYNRDRALVHQVVVLVEGVTDVWAVGDPAVALLGKTIGARQKILLQSWATKGGLLVIMLDADAKDDVEGILPDLTATFKERVVVVTLPDGRDPGDMSRDGIWIAIASACEQQRISLGDFVPAAPKCIGAN
jgi:hypothetical protein